MKPQHPHRQPSDDEMEAMIREEIERDADDDNDEPIESAPSDVIHALGFDPVTDPGFLRLVKEAAKADRKVSPRPTPAR